MLHTITTGIACLPVSANNTRIYNEACAAAIAWHQQKIVYTTVIGYFINRSTTGNKPGNEAIAPQNPER